MSIIKALQDYDQKVEDMIQNLRNDRNLLVKENSQLRQQLSKTTALLTRRTVGIGLLLTELQKTMSVEQIEELTMGNLDLVPRVEFLGLTLVLTPKGERLPVVATNVRTLPEVVIPLRNGPSMWPGANHIREGFVMRPASVEPEKVIPRVGRPVMKVVGEQYKLRGT